MLNYDKSRTDDEKKRNIIMIWFWSVGHVCINFSIRTVAWATPDSSRTEMRKEHGRSLALTSSPIFCTTNGKTPRSRATPNSERWSWRESESGHSSKYAYTRVVIAFYLYVMILWFVSCAYCMNLEHQPFACLLFMDSYICNLPPRCEIR